jgi:hypothetical protein
MKEIDIMIEIRNACAACFRVIARYKLAEELERELIEANVKKGFGVRFQKLIKKQEKNGKNIQHKINRRVTVDEPVMVIDRPVE